MKVAIVYTSVTGNTKELAEIIHQILLKHKDAEVEIYQVGDFPLSKIDEYSAIALGTYTWGNGDIPQEMEKLYLAFTEMERKSVITAVFGTGDRFYPSFCGAVDKFRDMLFVHTNLAVTLKVELFPQLNDYNRCVKFVDLLLCKKCETGTGPFSQ